MIFLANSDELTREIYGNIGPTAKVLFYFLAIISVGIFAHGIWKRWSLWQIGKDSREPVDWKASASRLVNRVFSQSTVRSGVRKKKAGRFHSMMFAGFCVLFIGTCLVALEEYSHMLFGEEGKNLFHKGIYFVVYEIFLDTFGLLYTIGAGWFLVRMLRKGGGDSVEYRKSDYFLITSLLIIGLSGYWIEGLRIIREDTPYPWISYVGNSFAYLFRALGVNETNVSLVHFIVWWGHGILVFAFIASFPYT